jgi:hypothetical protein
MGLNSCNKVKIDMEGYEDDYDIAQSNPSKLVHDTGTNESNNIDNKKQVPIFPYVGSYGKQLSNDEINNILTKGGVIKNAYNEKILKTMPNIGDSAEFEDYAFHVGNYCKSEGVISVHNYNK